MNVPVRPTMILEVSWGSSPTVRRRGAPVGDGNHPAPSMHLTKASMVALTSAAGRIFVQHGMLWRGGRMDYAHLAEIEQDGARRFVAHVARAPGKFAWDGPVLAAHDVKKRKLFLHDARGTLFSTVPLSSAELQGTSLLACGAGRVVLIGNGVLDVEVPEWPAPGPLPSPQQPMPEGRPTFGRIGGAELGGACPEPLSYAVNTPPSNVRFDAAVGWALNATPETVSPCADVLVSNDDILGFYRVASGFLRLEQNFILAAIQDVRIAPSSEALPEVAAPAARGLVRAELVTPSGTTVFVSEQELAEDIRRRVLAASARPPQH